MIFLQRAGIIHSLEPYIDLFINVSAHEKEGICSSWDGFSYFLGYPPGTQPWQEFLTFNSIGLKPIVSSTGL